MGSYVALLRAVNVSGTSVVKMADLVGLFEKLGHSDVSTLLASGNVLFRGKVPSTGDLEERLESAARARLGLETVFFVRSAAEWAAALAANPFPSAAAADPGHLLVAALKTSPGPGRERALAEAIVGREQARIVGRQAYLVYPDGVGRSKLTADVIERHLGTRATSRNWNTASKLLARLRALGDP